MQSAIDAASENGAVLWVLPNVASLEQRLSLTQQLDVQEGPNECIT
jgi:hypothetical protein